MNIAKSIKNQIDKYYENNYINHADLAKHLTENRIDSFEPTHQHIGFDKPDNSAYPIILYYEDDSILVVSGVSIFTAKKE